MKLQKQTQKSRCDMPMCNNISDYVISSNGEVSKNNVYMCNQCVKEIYGLIGSILIPKSPPNIVKKSRSEKYGK